MRPGPNPDCSPRVYQPENPSSSAGSAYQRQLPVWAGLLSSEFKINETEGVLPEWQDASCESCGTRMERFYSACVRVVRNSFCRRARSGAEPRIFFCANFTSIIALHYRNRAARRNQRNARADDRTSPMATAPDCGKNLLAVSPPKRPREPGFSNFAKNAVSTCGNDGQRVAGSHAGREPGIAAHARQP